MELNPTTNDIYYVNFNQDGTMLSLGTNQGFSIYSITEDEPVKRISRKYQPIGICEMLFKTNVITLVGKGEDSALSERQVKVVPTNDPDPSKHFADLSHPYPVLAVKLNKKRMVVVLESKIYIYDTTENNWMKLLAHFDTVVPNTNGVCALSPDPTNNYLAYPSSNEKGHLTIFDTFSLQPFKSIEAHQEPVTKMAWSADGTLLATCSARGTLIRVFSMKQEGKCIYQFRRGTMASTITSLSFCPKSEFMCVSSGNGTVHIFKLDEQAHPHHDPDEYSQRDNNNNNSNSNKQVQDPSYFSYASDYLSSITSTVSNFIPDLGSRPVNSFPFNKPVNSISFLQRTEKGMFLVIVTQECILYKCKFDPASSAPLLCSTKKELKD